MRRVSSNAFFFLAVTGLLVLAFLTGAPSNQIEGELPVVGSYSNLKSILEGTHGTAWGTYLRMGADMVAEGVQAPDGAGKESKADTDHSSTNVQVQGVDEGDVVKTDGRYIYQINNNRVIITLAYPAEQMKVAEILLFEGSFNPVELYVDEKFLVIIGHSYGDIGPWRQSIDGPSIGIMPPYQGSGLVKAMVYDIRDMGNIVKLRDLEIEGFYISSRKIDSSLYIVASKHIDYYRIMNEYTEEPAPVYRDSAVGKNYTAIGYDEIRYFPRSPEPNYLLVAGVDLSKAGDTMEVQAYLGAGQNVYASANSLYVAVTQYEEIAENIREDKPQEIYTGIYRFNLKHGQVSFSVQGRVPGVILNQFSMDEHRGFFRVATTSGEMWRDDEFTSRNNVYILDQKLEVAGRLEGLAPGERIYSARFMGDRGYMVTFRDVDPLFVIDLKDPYKPRVLGELKIPGYSDYLHPFDENHLIGFGKDTVEARIKIWDGQYQNMAFYLGMKVSLFDVTDVANPVERFKVIIGDRGTDSELLYNHKALLFNKEKGLLAFPVTLMEVKGPLADSQGYPNYGEFAFQGLYVFDLNARDGFTLRGRITHLEKGEQSKGWYYGDNYINRSLYIDENLYVLSGEKISAHRLSDLTDINTLKLIK